MSASPIRLGNRLTVPTLLGPESQVVVAVTVDGRRTTVDLMSEDECRRVFTDEAD